MRTSADRRLSKRILGLLQTPPAQDLIAWFDASTLEAGAIEEWPSRAGLFHASEASGFPSVVLAELNGLPVVRFNGSVGLNTFRFQRPMVAYTAFCVFRSTQVPSGDEMIFGGDDATSGADPSYFIGVDASNFFILNSESDGDKLVGPERDSLWHRSTVVRDGANSTLDVDGNLFGPASVGPLDPLFFSLGLRRNEWSGNTRGNHFTGDIAEAIVYEGVQPADARGRVEEYLLRKWGV